MVGNDLVWHHSNNVSYFHGMDLDPETADNHLMTEEKKLKLKNAKIYMYLYCWQKLITFSSSRIRVNVLHNTNIYLGMGSDVKTLKDTYILKLYIGEKKFIEN